MFSIPEWHILIFTILVFHIAPCNVYYIYSNIIEKNFKTQSWIFWGFLIKLNWISVKLFIAFEFAYNTGLNLYLIIEVQGADNLEFSDVVRHYLGQWGEYVSVIFSVLSLVGATVVYWILMSNFLYNTVLFIFCMHLFSMLFKNITSNVELDLLNCWSPG